jgi:hypothetical protein
MEGESCNLRHLSSKCFAADFCLSVAPLRYQVFILSDGSVTRHLQLLTGYKVDVVRQVNIDL